MQNLQMAFKNKKKVFLKSIKSKNTKRKFSTIKVRIYVKCCKIF